MARSDSIYIPYRMCCTFTAKCCPCKFGSANVFVGSAAVLPNFFFLFLRAVQVRKCVGIPPASPPPPSPHMLASFNSCHLGAGKVTCVPPPPHFLSHFYHFPSVVCVCDWHGVSPRHRWRFGMHDTSCVLVFKLKKSAKCWKYDNFLAVFYFKGRLQNV